MTKNRFLILAIISLTFSNCKRSIDHTEFEKKVFYEVFPKIADSLRIYNQPLPPPPIPAMPIFNKNNEVVRYDTTGNFKRLKNWKNKILESQNDTTGFVIAVNNKAWEIQSIERRYLNKYFEGYNLEMDKTDSIHNFAIELGRLKTKNNVIFKPISEFPNGYKIWREKYDFDFYGIFTMSEIIFDTSKQFGVFQISRSKGRLNGGSYCVLIKKNENSWNIVDIILLTIS